ncbi:MAG: GNAT family N-acetyltransferase [Candidatus Binatia bacterium]
MTGYLHRHYAESLAGFGVPSELPGSKGWILERPIAGFDYCDAMGCYPIFVCQDWSQLETDLAHVGNSLVCLSLVTDPFGECDLTYLRHCFRNVVIPFKEHFVVDLTRPLDTFVHSHHRRNARKALQQLEVERCARPADFLDDWTALYETLIERHNITGIAAFSRESFTKQLIVPGLVAFRAVHNGTTAGMLLWYAQSNRAYYHLGAYSERGYELRASFALFNYSIEYFAQHGLDWLNLGAGAGAGISEASGLSRFKQGWSTDVRTAYFCGRIFDESRYREIVKAKGVTDTDYFPAYRQGEFR